jgi:hypothetical protein
VIPVNLTRTHASVARLCRIAGVAAPPKFAATIRPRPAALIEFQFATELTPRQGASLARIAEAVSPLAQDLSSFECDHRYIVLASKAASANNIYLAGLTRVPPSVPARDAHDHWIITPPCSPTTSTA